MVLPIQELLGNKANKDHPWPAASGMGQKRMGVRKNGMLQLRGEGWGGEEEEGISPNCFFCYIWLCGSYGDIPR